MAVAASRFDVAQALAVSALVLALLVCTATDLLRYRVPNAITYPGTLLALLAALVMPGADFQSALFAFVAAGLGFLALALATNGGFGLGDVKLAALIGAALGLQASYQALFLGIVGGGLILLLLFMLGAVGRKQAVPYAPFLALAAVAVVLMHGAAFAPH
jgi:leader peptidase (prepilin peptidase)/N-methyltransferase